MQPEVVTERTEKLAADGGDVLPRKTHGGVEVPELLIALFACGPSSPKIKNHCSPNDTTKREFFYDTLFLRNVQ